MSGFAQALAPGNSNRCSGIGPDMELKDPPGVFEKTLKPKALRTALRDAMKFCLAGAQ